MTRLAMKPVPLPNLDLGGRAGDIATRLKIHPQTTSVRFLIESRRCDSRAEGYHSKSAAFYVEKVEDLDEIIHVLNEIRGFYQ